MASIWCRSVLALQVIIVLVCVIRLSYGKPRICLGKTCEKVVKVEAQLGVLEAYCHDICYGKQRDVYNVVCNCEKIITTLPPPCTTSYVQGVACKWANQDCKDEKYCEWRRKKSLDILSSSKIQEACDCPLKDTALKNPCDWTQEDVTLCSVLKENRMLYADFQCVCNHNAPERPPASSPVCEYSKHRDAQLTPRRQKRLFAGQDAYQCNYPGVVGLFTINPVKMSICTATLLSPDTILFDSQCKGFLNDKVYALVNSYDVSMVDENSPTVNVDTIKQVDDRSAANALFTASLTTKLFLDDRCVRPACLPNDRTPAHYLDLEDCRVLGYGNVDDKLPIGGQATRLQEIHVKVADTSVKSPNLEIIRNDNYHNTACMYDFSAPVVCSHKFTKEWITVGIHKNAGVICSGKSLPDTFQVANLLGEAMGNNYFERLRHFQPAHEKEIPI